MPDELGVADGRLGRMALEVAQAVVDLVADRPRKTGPRELGAVPRIGKPFWRHFGDVRGAVAVVPPVTVISPRVRRLSNVRSELSSYSSFGKRAFHQTFCGTSA